VAEYRVVTLLVSRKGKLHTYRAIYDTVHYAGFVAGSGARGYTTNVRSMIKRIRRKCLAVDPGFSEIKNVLRAGYCWRDPQFSGLHHARAPVSLVRCAAT
jgi:two-component system response regulator ChvI